MYKPLSRYPSIKRDVTIETDRSVPYEAIAALVELSHWNTKARRSFKCIDIYEKDKKFTTFRLKLEDIRKQPATEDMDFWFYMIDRYLRGLEGGSYIGEIQGYEPTFTHEAHIEVNQTIAA